VLERPAEESAADGSNALRRGQGLRRDPGAEDKAPLLAECIDLGCLDLQQIEGLLGEL